MLHKTLDDTIKTIREVIAEAGEDYVYTDNYDTCYYSIEGKPACLVGRVLAKWGVLPEDTDPTFGEGGRVGMFAHELLDDMKDSEELSVDTEAAGLLQLLQTVQDAGAAWGSAFAHALGESEK